MSSVRIDPIFQLVVESRPERVMSCYEAMLFYPRRLRGIVHWPKINHDNGDGFIEVDLGLDSHITAPYRRFLAALVTVGLATGWYLARLDTVYQDGEILETFPQKFDDEDEEHEGNGVFAE